ncbi:hypothetical protein [Psychrobacter aestuarii]|uniref:DUF4878 domain-containing protein n=1 Tax=Psychrobacter aestuarii TaxID=556327 RepID=A0ABN0VUJ0_9GAMM|nr:hypothetical protein [Psychrobacter aestuarii]
MPMLSKRLSALMLGTVISTLMMSGCSNASDKEVETTEGPDMAVTENADMNAESEAPAEQTSAADTTETDSTLSDVMVDAGDNASASSQSSIVTNTTSAGTPEDTVKKALNATYYGNVEDAVDYYKVDMADFKQQLADTQMAFQKTVDSITLTDTKYNEDKTKATVNGELMLKGQDKPTPATYELQKVDGAWKILG